MTKIKTSKGETDISFSVPMISDDTNCNIGEIKINHSVIANIATLSAMETKGVLGVGKSGIANGIASFFSRTVVPFFSNKKPMPNGVTVAEDELGNYIIDIYVMLKFGCELAQVASDIQQNVARHISKMTNTIVSKVNIVIDGVEISEDIDTE